jgi:hypothetical protein
MTPNTYLLGLAAGLISAIVFASATTGPMLARFAFFFLTPLALYLAGLGLGPVAAAIGAVAATVAVALIANPVAALVFGVSEALPAALLTRQALLARGDGGERQWFPAGWMVSTAALLGGISALLLLLLMGGDYDALSKSMQTFVEHFVKTELPGLPGAPAIDDAKIPLIAEITLKLLPAALALAIMTTILVNLWIAGRITLASGRLVRPWPDLGEMKLPGSSTFALLIALALSFAGGFPGLAAGAFAGTYMFAFALMGLAVAHFVTRGSPWRPFILAALYLVFVIYSFPATLLLAIIGLGESLFGYRAALTRGPPPGHV